MKVRKAWLALALLVATGGCESEELANIAVGDLGGIWLSASYVFTDNSDSQLSRDLVAEDGALLTLSVDNTTSPPTVSAQFDDGFGGGWTDQGEVDVVAGTLTIGAGVFSIAQDGNQMTLTNAVTAYSFPGVGNRETTLVIELDRL